MMQTSSFPDYAASLRLITDALLSQGLAIIVDLSVDQRSAGRGFVRGIIVFDDGSQLHIREFVDFSTDKFKLMYVYQYQDDQKQLIFRYDNAAHKPPVDQPEHKHTIAGVVPAFAPALADVIDEIIEQR